MADKKEAKQDAEGAEPKSGAACKNPPAKSAADAKDPKADAKDAEGSEVPAKVDEEEDEPEPRVYTPEEIEEISKKVESYRDNTPPYEPTRMLSPEFEGTSNYERGIGEFREQKLAELERLRADPDVPPVEVAAAEDSIRTLDNLYENYNLGMNVFRTAKGGRSKLRE